MASARQLEANKRNAQKSTGPVTAEGKAKSKFNALKHGLTAATAILPGEDGVAYHDLRGQLLDELQPETVDEWMILDQLVSAWWRTLRVRRVETSLMKLHTQTLIRKHNARPIESEEQLNDALAVCFTSHPDQGFKTLERHSASIERSFYRAWDRFQKLKAQRLRATKKMAAVKVAAAGKSECSEMGMDSICTVSGDDDYRINGQQTPRFSRTVSMLHVEEDATKAIRRE